MKTGMRQKAIGNCKKTKVVGFALCAMLFALCAAAEAQQRIRRIGYLSSGKASPTNDPGLSAFRTRLRELGYVEGQNAVIEARYGELDAGQLAAQAAELVSLRVDVILTSPDEPPIRAAQLATRTIPVVMPGIVVDPLEPTFWGEKQRAPLVASLANPGGNFTGPQQPTRVPRIGYLTTTFASEVARRVEALRQGLFRLGYVEGKSIVIEYRYGQGKPDRLPALTTELIDLKVDLIVTHGFPPARAAKQATTTIPIVMAVIGDAVGAGLVTSLARPGGNITGLTSISSEMYGKRLELLKEISPKISRVAILSSETSPATEIAMNELKVAANALKMQLEVRQVRGPNDIEDGFDAMAKAGAGAFIMLQGPLTSSYRKLIIDLATKSRRLAIYHESEFPDAGGLMSYGVNYQDMYRRAATFVDKILKGAKPADLPVEQPTKFEFVINLKTAKQIGLTIPPNVLARADRVIR
jgi:putative tryptophan/tyrosine transport system substrate-binding protein